jgi:hypothetical protein
MIKIIRSLRHKLNAMLALAALPSQIEARMPQSSASDNGFRGRRAAGQARASAAAGRWA